MRRDADDDGLSIRARWRDVIVTVLSNGLIRAFLFGVVGEHQRDFGGMMTVTECMC
jgi:hypothetical protein